MQTHIPLRDSHLFEPASSELISLGTAQFIITGLALATTILAILELALS